MTGTFDHITQRLRSRMPLSEAMGVQVLEHELGCVKLWAPLSKNLNYHQTAFGGSIATLGILAGWMLLNLNLNEDWCTDAPYQIVIQESKTEYLQKIDRDMEAICRLPVGENWPRFGVSLKRKQVGRLTLVAEILCDGVVAARETGIYVATVNSHA